ncbi:MAG: Chaperonin 10 Kd subunit [Bacteroidota bacterium]|jgi:co-chaperonin GroES (HSP10)
MIKPLGNKVVVERLSKKDNTTESGIILKSTEEPDRAIIMAIGSEVDEVSVGEVVLINWNKATKYKDEIFVIPITEVVFVYE